jgi:hypothetical protein
MSLLKRFRNWLDGIDYDDAQAGQDENPRNPAEEFLVTVAREIERVMRAEMFTPPGGPTYIPRSYLVYLNPEDDARWRGEKRRGLEQGLFHVLSEQAAKLIGKQQNLQTTSFTVELLVDETLKDGQFSVQAVWDTEAEKTMVRPRVEKQLPVTAPTVPIEQDEATLVRPRTLFAVMVKHQSDTQPKQFKFNKPSIVIGRGSRQIKVDLPLEGDMEMSREQAAIEYQGGNFVVTCKGRNSIFIDGAELLPDESMAVKPGQRIEICTYLLQLETNVK